MAKSIMLVGTSSNVGKSVLCTALCRILTQDGFRVAPFKAQNMSLNSAVTPSGREIGRAQAVQAEACGIAPNEHMNPVLLKPTGQMRSQVVLQGRVHETKSAREYFLDQKDALWAAVKESYRFLADRYQVIVMEGAGSPVEMNLKSRDIVNMRAAEMADASVLLVADIDRGGVFASIVGTLQLLEQAERDRVKGIIINKFRGDPMLFEEGIQLLESYTGVPVLGVIPYIRDIGIDEEDSVGIESERYRNKVESQTGSKIRIAIVHVPHISNFTDFDPLFLEPDVDVFFCQNPEELEGVSAVILPGTKSTMEDLQWLQGQGFFNALKKLHENGTAILGICGGYQMLGMRVLDPTHQESEADERSGLCVIPVETEILPSKQTVLVSGKLLGIFADIPVSGYEIHMGLTRYSADVDAFASVRSAYDSAAGESSVRNEGCVSADGLVIGTYLHGILHNDEFRTCWLNRIFETHGLPVRRERIHMDDVRNTAYNQLADVVRSHLNMDLIRSFL